MVICRKYSCFNRICLLFYFFKDVLKDEKVIGIVMFVCNEVFFWNIWNIWNFFSWIGCCVLFILLWIWIVVIIVIVVNWIIEIIIIVIVIIVVGRVFLIIIKVLIVIVIVVWIMVRIVIVVMGLVIILVIVCRMDFFCVGEESFYIKFVYVIYWYWLLWWRVC